MNIFFLGVTFFVLASFDRKEIGKKNQRKLLAVYVAIFLLSFTLWLMYFLQVNVPSINSVITTIVRYVF